MHRDPGPVSAVPPALALGPSFVLDLARGELLDAQGRPADLRAQALRVLLVLGHNAGQVVGKNELMQQVWGALVVTEDSLVQAVGDIRRVLGDDAHRLVRTVPRRGYRLVPESTPAGTTAAMLPSPAPSSSALSSPALSSSALASPARSSSAPAMTTATARTARSWPAAVGALLLLLVIAAGAWAVHGSAGRGAAPPRSLAILPFESDPAGSAEDWFLDGVSADLTAIVSGWRDALLIGRGTMAGYKGRTADPRNVARELGVRYVLTGRARRDGDQVRLALALIDGRSGNTVWSEQRDVPRAELRALVGDVAGGIARTLTVEFGDAVAADARALQPHEVQADDLSMQGTAELLRGVSQQHWERARELFERAVAADPTSVRGLGGLSLANSNLVLFEWTSDRAGTLVRAEQALVRLERLAPDHMLANLSRASMAHARHDWEGVLVIGDRLVEHHPNEPTAHHHRCSSLLRLGRFDDSIAACARALRISPRDSRAPIWHGLTGFSQYQLGRHALAEQQLRQAVLGNPRLTFYAVALAAALAEQGRRDEGEQVLKEVMARQPDFRQGSVRGYWVARDARFVAGRDRIAAVAGELGLPP